jgi:hypothetical protein
MEEAGAKKAGGVAISIPTCHVAMLQEPQKVADLITEAARTASTREFLPLYSSTVLVASPPSDIG